MPFRIIDSRLLERIAQEHGVGEGDTFIDLGLRCRWPGLVGRRTHRSLTSRLDFAASAVEAATLLADRRNLSGRARFEVANATATGMSDASVTGVMSIDALMFVDAQEVSAEIARVLKRGGILVMTAGESLVEPSLPTLVRDYRLVFENFGFRTLHHEEPTGHKEQQLALYRALYERVERLRAEIGEVAEVLLDEACNGLAHAEQKTARIRNVLYIAQRT